MTFANELKKICPNRVKLDKKDVYTYAFDTSKNPDEIILPIAVVFPKNALEVSKIVKLCLKNDITIIPRAKGTNHVGLTRPTKNSIVLHFSLMDKIISIDKQNLIAIVEPNVVIGELNKHLDKQNLFFPPDPSNLAVSTIGGAVALNSGGPRTFKYGNTKDYVINLEVVLADGTIIQTNSNLAKNVTGYNLTSIFVGSEGTLGIITKITLKLIPKPEKRLLTLAYFDSLTDAAICSNNIINSGLMPSTIDLLDNFTLKTIENYNPTGLLVDKKAALLIELDGFYKNVLNELEILKEILLKSNAKDIIQTKLEEQNEKIWRARRSAFSALTQIMPDVITEDIVVPRDKIVDFINKVDELSKKYNIIAATMGHIADGNIHPNFALNLEKQKKDFEKLKDELFYYVIEINGTLSGEHGIGVEKKKYLKVAIDNNSYELMKKIKNLLDPKDIFNRGKSL